MPKTRKIIALVLVLTLGLSVLANVVLFLEGRSFYTQLNALRLDPYELSSLPLDVPAQKGPMLVVYGDSRAAEWRLPPSQGFTYVNRGIASQTTAQVVGRFRAHVLELEPDILLLQVGINDLKTIPLFPERMNSIIETAFENIATLIRLSTNQDVCVILTTVFPIGKVPFHRRPFWSRDVEIGRRILNNRLSALAADNVWILDFDDVLASSAGNSVPTYFRDMLHLTPDAYASLWPRVSEAVQRIAAHQHCGAKDRHREGDRLDE